MMRVFASLIAAFNSTNWIFCLKIAGVDLMTALRQSITSALAAFISLTITGSLSYEIIIANLEAAGI